MHIQTSHIHMQEEEGRSLKKGSQEGFIKIIPMKNKMIGKNDMLKREY